MRIAKRNNEIYWNYAERFTDAEITSSPYNYVVIDIEDSVDVSKIEISDFEKDIFSLAKYNERLISEELKSHERCYKDRIVELIRVRYSLNDELAILRQLASKPSEYAEYNAYIEKCKVIARVETVGK